MSYWIQLKHKDGLTTPPFAGEPGSTPKAGQMISCTVGGRTIQVLVSKVHRSAVPVPGAERADLVEVSEF
jgi:hypothetical protein